MVYPLSGSVSERVARTRQTIPASVRLIAVTKQVPVEAMREAYEAGIRDFGESRVQEAEGKQAQLQDLPDITWHLIGHLQANKAQKALQLFHWIHSVDNLKLAQRLDRLAEPFTQKPIICLQVKIRPDPAKYGWMAPELLADLAALNEYHHLAIQGLMMIPPLGLNAAQLLDAFQQTHTLATQIRDQNWSHIHIHELSMGMSEDYELAVQAGATMVRLGRILFGDRTL
ncbi:MAG: YggS family pyridoxal phosphate-dependent enzyme [Leptolyngbyaceae cyanobacterium RU_5_1]|nr:YggS family pyridoxal phosphate-dependent enzyme [Leptolyngbyaceae cyanobacterium RU_5_1]